MSSKEQDIARRIEEAERDAKERGLPDGWKCSINSRGKRVWTSPDGEHKCKSIPHALEKSEELGLLPADTEDETGKGKRKSTGTTNQDDEEKPIHPRKTIRLDEASESEVAEKDSDGEEGSSTGAPLKEVLPKKSSDGKEHTSRVQQQSQSIETSRSGTVSIASVQPDAPYKENVLGRMVWLRPKQDKKRYWIRGKVVGCDISCCLALQEDGSVVTREKLDHVIECADDEVCYTANLQKREQLGDIVWM